MSITGTAEPYVYDEIRGKISSLSPYALDKTLSAENCAAEANAVGKALGNKLNTSSVADNLTTDSPDKVLSAKQGKLLKEAVDDLRESTSASFDVAKSSADKAQTAADNAQTAANNAQSSADNAQTTADKALLRSGGEMTGNILMAGNCIKGLPEPIEDGDPVTKGFMVNYIDTTFLGGVW